jgi:membrane protein required for colicin V production
MNYLDIVLAIFLVSGLINGIKNGFFVELASLVSMLLGIYVAIKCSYLMKAYLEHHVSWNPKTIQVAAFALTFILVVIGVSLLARFFTSVANFASLGLYNKLLGGIFGILRTVLMLSIVLNLLQKINFDHTFVDQETMDESQLYHPVQEVSKSIYPAIEDWFTAFKSRGFELENTPENE